MNASERLEDFSTEQNQNKQANNRKIKRQASQGQSSRQYEVAEMWFGAEETLGTRKVFCLKQGKIARNGNPR